MKGITLFTASAFLLLACEEPIVPPNNPPVAMAGPDQNILLPLNNVELSGTGRDSDGEIIYYHWSKIYGPSATIVTPDQAQTTVSDLVKGVYLFQLTVIDDFGDSGIDTLLITVNEIRIPTRPPPVVDAGPNKSISLPTNSVTLTGTGTDSYGTISSYLWSKISGPQANITTPNQAQTEVTDLVQGSYQFQLTVTNDLGVSGSDFVFVLVESGTLVTNWITLDTEAYIEYDSAEFYLFQFLLNEISWNGSNRVTIAFRKRIVDGETEYIRLPNPIEVSVVLPSNSDPFIFHFEWDIDSLYGLDDVTLNQYGYNSYNASYAGRVAFMQAIEEMLSHEYRFINIPIATYNSIIGINWNNYLEVVPALNLDP